MKQELERIEIPDEHDARERSWAVVSAAFAEREPQPRRRSWKPVAVVALAVVVVAGLLSPPGRAVLDEIREVVGVEGSAPALFSLPARGGCSSPPTRACGSSTRTARSGCSATTARRRGRRSAAIVVAARANELVALTPGGTVRWSLARPDVRLPRWGGSRTDTRIAYFSRGQLRVVGGDGKGDRLLDADAAERAPVWLPGGGHRLAYATRDGSVRVVDVDTGAVHRPRRSGAPARAAGCNRFAGRPLDRRRLG